MKKITSLAILVGILHLLYAQDKPASENITETSQLLKVLSDSPDFDSLKRKASADVDNQSRATTLFAITAQYLNTNLDSSLKYIGEFNDVPAKSKLWEANGLVIMGDIYLRLGNSSLALENFLKGTRILQQLNDSTGMGMAYWNLGKLYQSIGESSRAIDYYSNSIKISSSINAPVPWSYSMGHLGQLYLELNHLDSAFYYSESAYKKLQEVKDRRSYEPILQAQLGNIYQEKGNISLAKLYYRMALQTAALKDNLAGASDACIGMATLFKGGNAFDSCYRYAREGFNLAQQLNKPDLVLKASMFLKDLFKENKILDSAFQYQEIMIAASDSIHSIERINKVHVISFAEQQRIEEAKTQKREFQNKIRQYALAGSLVVFLCAGIFLYRNNRQKQKANALLQSKNVQIENTLKELRSTQAQLLQSEKMASLGELTAGIAHEIQNPLNFVNNFSEVSNEMIDELKGERSKVKGERDEAVEDEIINDIQQNLEKINHHGKRADAIVKGMLQHSRISSGQKELTDINALCDEYVRLAYHGLKAKDKSFDVKIETVFDPDIGKINVVPQDIGRVILNLINNAFYAVSERTDAVTGHDGHEEDTKNTTRTYEPAIIVTTKKLKDQIEISVKDNGNGIPKNIVDKIFQPFFTTKPTGKGTGLGLSLAYDIMKAHGGEIKAESNEGEGSNFIIQLPS